jgi:hypothetical protein
MRRLLLVFIPIFLISGCASGNQQITTDNPLIINGAGNENATTEVVPSISITVTNIDQSYYDLIDEWSTHVKYDYVVTNTGTVDIDYYEIAFVAICANGEEFREWDNGSDVAVGKSKSDNYMIDVKGLEVVDIIVERYGFEPYSTQ